MSDQSAVPPAQNASSELQFDRAELPAAKKCAFCRANVNEDFFKVESKIACGKCHVKVLEQLHGGSGAKRLIKASVYGTFAAALGAGIYYAILAATGYELALISILVGVMVGAAVKKGSDSRGGWLYQTLAIFLTYTAIASAYVPLIITEFAKKHADKATVTAPSADPKSTPSASTVPTAESEPPPPPSPPTRHMNPILALIVLIGLLYALPIIVGFHSLIGLFIIGIGLYQAWKINRRVTVKITGPFAAHPTVNVAS